MFKSSASSANEPGIRSVCDLGLRIVPSVDEDMSFEAMEPGDIVFFRTSSNWLSRLITSLDGYWSHTALYVGDGLVAHVAIGGASVLPLEQMVGMYSDGVAFARPERSRQERFRAAEWASNFSPENPNRPLSKYSGSDLGLAFGLLCRAKANGGRERLPPVEDGDTEFLSDEFLIDDGLESVSGKKIFESTCSGFVYQCYDQDSATPLEIEPAPGLRVEDGRLFFPEGPALMDELLAEEPPGATDEALEGLFDINWREMKDRAHFVAEVATSTIKFAIASGGVAIHDGVSPADLWCSPEVAGHHFLRQDHLDKALVAASHCD